MRLRLAALLALVAVLAVGCGSASGGGSASGDASGLVPQGALAFVTIGTDFGSSQWQSARSILGKFPLKTKVTAAIDSALSEHGLDPDAVKASVGPELDVAVLKVDGETNAVGFTQPKDAPAFDAQLDKAAAKHTMIDGWTVFADSQAFLDAVTGRSANLSDSAHYQAAMKTVPGSSDALARLYASPAGTATALGAAKTGLGAAAGSLGPIASGTWYAGALTSSDGAFKVEVHEQSAQAAAPAGAGLADKIPSGAFVALHL